MDRLMPREKLERFGAAHLTDAELLRILIGSGNKQASAEQIAKRLLRLLSKRRDAVTCQEVSDIPGMGPAKTCEVVALFELGRRFLLPVDRPVIKTPEDAFAQLEYLRDKKQECLSVITLDGANRIIDNTVVFQGALDYSLVHPREIFKEAYKVNASYIICLHNHPSGDPTPSEVDVEYTELSMKVAGVLGIEFMDHIVIGNGKYISILSEMASKIAKDLKTKDGNKQKEGKDRG